MTRTSVVPSQWSWAPTDPRPTPQELQAIRRGDVVWFDPDPSEGAEQKKARPAIVVSSDDMNANTHLLMVVPCSTHGEGAPPRKVEVGLGDGCYALPHQLRTVDRRTRVLKVFKGQNIGPEVLRRLALKLAQLLDLASVEVNKGP